MGCDYPLARHTNSLELINTSFVDMSEMVNCSKVTRVFLRTSTCWMTGTQSHESMAGTLAAIEHLAWLGRIISDDDLSRREALRSFSAIEDYESELCWDIQGLQEIDGVKIWGVMNHL